MAAIQHMEPELDYGGYYDDDDESYDEYYIEEEIVEEEIVEEDILEDAYEPPAPSGDNMAAMIAAAASKRKERIDREGPVQITKPRTPATPKMDMAAMVAAKAKKRNERIDAGGTIQITDVQEERVIPEEHQKVFVSVASEAANVGKLLRFGEHTVEAVAAKKEEQDTWSGPGGLRTDNYRSNFFKAVQEAAAVGQVKLRQALETTNYDPSAFQEEEPELEDIDKKTDDQGRRVVRQEYLIDYQIEERRREKVQEWKSDEDKRVEYKSLHEVVLPSRNVPGWKPKNNNTSKVQSMDDIAKEVALRAWERNYRLGRPKAPLKMTRLCQCEYCRNPNPFQTHKYKNLYEEGVRVVADPMSLEKARKQKKWSPPKRTPPPPSFRSNVLPSAQADVKPGDWKSALENRPKPPPIQAKPKPSTPPPMEEEEVPKGPVILLDETITYHYRRPKAKKPDKDKKKKKTKKKKGIFF